MPPDGTTSTPCISTASSFATASSYCGDTDEMFQFDPFSEPFKTEVHVCLTMAHILEDRNNNHISTVSRSILIHTVFRKKHPFTFSFISPWKMSRFTQNFQGMFMRNKLFCEDKN